VNQELASQPVVESLRFGGIDSEILAKWLLVQRTDFWGDSLPNTVQIRGDGNVIQIDVFGYERPDANDEYDANWLRAKCSVTVAEFSAILSLALVTRDFARFADELEQAVQLLKGTAAFSTVEAGLGIEIKFTTAGHAEVFGSARSQTSFVPDQSVLSFSFETDQTYLAQSVRELKAIVSRFPVRNPR